jgi:hypothetical protein
MMRNKKDRSTVSKALAMSKIRAAPGSCSAAKMLSPISRPCRNAVWCGPIHSWSAYPKRVARIRAKVSVQ